MSLKIKVPLEELKKRKLMVATPMYGGNCHGNFARAIADLSATCASYGIPLRYYFLFNESLITRGRAYAADEFMRSDCTHLMFIDSDIGFKAGDVISMLALQNPDPSKDGYDILAGPYPKKSISWEKIKTAVDKGFADDSPEHLSKFVGDYVFNPAGGTRSIPLNAGPAEVLETGTGFMMIRRNTFDKFAEAYPEKLYNPDHIRTEHFDGSRKIMMFFDTPIDNKYESLTSEAESFIKENPNASAKELAAFLKDPNKSYGTYSNRYLSEDYFFCQWSRKIGMKTWICPWIELTHTGTYTFGGTLKDMAALGVTATADPKQIKKKKK